MSLAWCSILNLSVGGLLAGISLPLLRRQVPPNDTYGIRIPAALESEKNWYDINAAGGKIFLGWSVPIILVGLVQMFAPPNRFLSYEWLNLVLLSPALACLHSGRAARKIAARNRAG